MQPKKFVIRKSPSSAPAPAPAYYQPQVQQEQETHGALCFSLGALFGPFGLLLAAIVGKAGGLVKALLGFVLVGLPLTGLAWWLMFGADMVAEQKRRARIERDNAEFWREVSGSGDLVSPGGRPVNKSPRR